MEVWANDRFVEEWAYRLEEETPASRRFLLPRDSLSQGEVLEIAFVLRDPCRPMELGLSEDPRRLGLFVRELRFVPA